ncbi:MAG: hypothetical protein EA353_13285 [Puniceicoccaceae bacterium]|nr:MAG: hypothetical protein EA353_13285 [Puniceicoccaceae bacterium]
MNVGLFANFGSLEEWSAFGKDPAYGIEGNKVFFVLSENVAKINDGTVKITELTIIRRSV